jgi:hypothetical protein
MKDNKEPFNNLRRMVRHLVSSHRFFWSESPKFVGVCDNNGRWHFEPHDLPYIPIAYFKFMKSSFIDALCVPNKKVEAQK